MTKQELEEKIKGLEARITLLEVRPINISYPVYIPYYEPYRPWSTYPYPFWGTTPSIGARTTTTTASTHNDSDTWTTACLSSPNVSA